MLCCCVSYHGLSFGTCVAVGLQELPVSYYNLWVAAGIWGFSLMGSRVFLRVVSSQYIYIYIYIYFFFLIYQTTSKHLGH